MCVPVSLDAHQIYTHMHVHAHGYVTPLWAPSCEDVCMHTLHAITTVCDWRQSVHPAQPTRFSRTGSVSPGEAGSHMPLQGATKPGSGQRLGAAGRLYLSSAGRWEAPVSLGTKILESAEGGKGREKEEVEGAPDKRGCRASFPGSVAFSLSLQVASQGNIKRIILIRGPD